MLISNAHSEHCIKKSITPEHSHFDLSADTSIKKPKHVIQMLRFVKLSSMTKPLTSASIFFKTSRLNFKTNT